MTCSYIVIGANYGDEGKGLITDFLARTAKPDYVVRFNGGAQAGHTVEADGNRQIFKHLSAGTLAGVPTLLSEFFICNPILFNSEVVSFSDAEVLVDPRAIVSTPFDMLVNQTLETARNGSKHGSCGIGINETVTRSEDDEFAIRVRDLLGSKSLKKKLIGIRDSYFPHRIASLGLDAKQACDLAMHMDASIFIDGFVDECEAFIDRINLISTYKLKPRRVVFEGAQGLGLDELNGHFPNVTRSRTGMTNALTLARAMKLGDNIKPVYVTRAYLTRHGAGPLEHETFDKPYAGVNEQTNIENTYQGAFRYGYLGIKALKRRIELDRLQAPYLDACLAVTCLDQVDEHVTVITPSNDENGKLKIVGRDSRMNLVLSHDLPLYLKSVLGPSITMVFGSRGPDAKHIRRES